MSDTQTYSSPKKPISQEKFNGIIGISIIGMGVLAYASAYVMETSLKLRGRRETMASQLVRKIRREEKSGGCKYADSDGLRNTSSDGVKHRYICGHDDLGYIVYSKRSVENEVIYYLYRISHNCHVSRYKYNPREKMIYSTTSLTNVINRYVKYIV